MLTNQSPMMSVDLWGLYTIFLGGAADHESFLGIVPATGIVRDLKNKFVNDFLKDHIKKAGYSDKKAEYLSTRHARYYGFNEINHALTDAKMFLVANPNAQVNIVGHSLGGWQAAHLAQEINAYKCSSVANLITLDPVGTDPLLRAFEINFFTPKPIADTWVNIRAELDGSWSGNNIIANAGGQWNPKSDNQTPDYNYQLNADYGNAEIMLTTDVTGQTFLPWELLEQYYHNESSNFNYTSVPDGLIEHPELIK